MLTFRRVTLSLFLCISLTHAAVIKFDNYIKPGQSAQAAYTTLVQSSRFLIVKFFKPGCGACQTNHFAKLAEKFPKITCVEINIMTYSGLFSPFGFPGVPAFVYYKDGNKVASHTGGVQNLESVVHKYFGL